jgi:hypothetical protein
MEGLTTALCFPNSWAGMHRRIRDKELFPGKVFEVPPEASTVSISFDFYQIDNWVNGTVVVSINGDKVELGAFSVINARLSRNGTSSRGITWTTTAMAPDKHGFLVNDRPSASCIASNSKCRNCDREITFEVKAYVGATKDVASAGFDNLVITAAETCTAGSSSGGTISGRSAGLDSSMFKKKKPASTPLSCKATEDTFASDSLCSMGYFGAEHIAIIEAKHSTVKFKVTGHSFPATTLSEVKVWFLDPKKTFTDELNQFCYSGSESSIGDGLFEQEFVAKCEDGFAVVSMSGGEDGSTKFKQFIDVEDPQCSSGVDSADFNPMKRCFWQFKVPCTCDGGRRELELDDTAVTATKTVTTIDATTMAECSRKSLVEDVHPVQVDKCITVPTKDTIQIVSQDKETVTFSVSQKWKGCNDNSQTLGWVATDYINAKGDLVCDKKSNLSCGLAETYTAHCTDGIAVVDLYSFDAQDGLFGQDDDSDLAIPLACKASGDEKKQCHFRYVLKCEPSLCEQEPKSFGFKKIVEPARRLGGKN